MFRFIEAFGANNSSSKPKKHMKINFSPKTYRIISVVLVVVTLFTVGWLVFANRTQAVNANQQFVDTLVTRANNERTKTGLPELRVNDKLSHAAYNKALDMLKNNYFAHTSPSGLTPWYWIDQEKYQYIFAGENLAINFATPEDTHDAWMNSESHRENIMSDHYDEVGIAMAEGQMGGKETIVVVQMFGKAVNY